MKSKKKDFDVVVVGGGVSGVIAAVASAKAGARTIIVEKNSFFGGTATASMVSQFLAFYHNKQQTVMGIPAELLERLKASNGSKGFSHYILAEASSTPLPVMRFPFDPEILKMVLDDFLKDANVSMLLCGRASNVILEDGRVTEVLIAGAWQKIIISTKCTVDASADAVLAERAGVQFLEDDNPDGQHLQPMTLLFRLSGVDVPKVRALPRNVKVELVKKGLSTGELYWKSLSFSSTPANNDAICMMSRVTGFNHMDDDDLTQAYIEGRRQIKSILRFLKQKVPGFENATLVTIAPSIGIRETRQILGEYVVTEDDVLNGQIFQDSVAVGSGPFDIHGSKGTDLILKMPETPFGIPYRCLIPKSVGGLIVTGRAISATKGAIATMRHMGTMMALGQAAGAAAALSAQSDRDPVSIDIQQLRENLVEQGALISPDMLQS